MPPGHHNEGRALPTAHLQRPGTPPPRNVRDHTQVSIDSPSASRNLSQNHLFGTFLARYLAASSRADDQGES